MSAQHSINEPQKSSTPHGNKLGLSVRRALVLARANCRVADLFRIGFGLIWAIDAGFKWQSGFRQGFMGMVMQEGQGQPGWLHGWFQFWINLQHPHSQFFAYATAVFETLIAVSLLLGFARKYLYIIGALFSLTIWGTAEGFGGPYGSTSTDIGAAVMYTVVFLGLLALNYEGGPSRFSVDYLIERRVSWWHRIAEVGHKDHTGERLHRPPVTTITPPVPRPPLETEPAQYDTLRPEINVRTDRNIE
jgi:uncharacterized membrane protein YphA (DoxX/SURF4 family)